MTGIKSRKYTAHQFRRFRRARGLAVRKMRERRGLSQSDIGAPSQIRRFENGEATQIGMMEILARLVLCPREALQLFKICLHNLPIACVKCRAACSYKSMDGESMANKMLGDVTLHDLDD